MSRFDATTTAERQQLFADAIQAHRERASPYLTIEAEVDDEGPDPDLGVPWTQFGDGIVNLDCTDAELDRCKTLIGEFPAFKIDDLTRPDEAEGVNVRVSAKADPNRISQFLDALFRRVYELPDDYRAWVVEL